MDIRRLRSKNIKELLTPHIDYSIRLGEKLNKKINPFSIEGDDVYLNQEEYNGLFKSLVHIFRNAVDHGIEEPDERLLNDKKESGNIQCDVKLSDNNFIIRIADDGTGIDLEDLRDKILSKAIIDQNTLSSIPDDELIQYIFRDNVSTRDSVTELSGRGVGLSAVYAEVNKLGGRIEVISSPKSGTEFIITIPFRKFINGKAFESVDILDIIVKTTKSFLMNEINFKEVLIDSVNEYEKERLTLKTFSSFIGIKGKVNAKVIITIEYKLAKHLLHHFLASDSIIQDEHKYLEDTVSETLNNIIGNSTQELVDIGKSIEFGTPVIMTSEEAIFKYPPTKKWNCSVKTDKGDFLLYFIQG
jgi:two-component system chemotaxis sensor kinase CheA